MSGRIFKNWDHKFDVSDLFHNDDLNLGEKAQQIADRMRAASWFEEDDWELACVHEELLDIALGFGADDEDELTSWFNDVWSSFYDWADANKHVWVSTR